VILFVDDPLRLFLKTSGEHSLPQWYTVDGLNNHFSLHIINLNFCHLTGTDVRLTGNARKQY